MIRPTPQPTVEEPGWVSTVAIVLITLTCGFAAAAYGGVEAWSSLGLYLLAGALGAVGLGAAFQRAGGTRARIVLGLFAAYATLAALQIAPLPLSLVATLSPERHGAVTRLLAEPPGLTTLSYNALETARSMRLLFIAGAVFAATAWAVRSPRDVKLLLRCLFGVGVAEACLAIAQQATDASGIYWGAVSVGEVRSGSFVNHSNFSQLLNLTLGAGLGLLLVRLSEERHDPSRPRSSRASVSELFRRHGWLLIGMTLQAVAIAASLSRAGLIAMLVASLVVAVTLRRRASGPAAWGLAVIPLLAFVGLVFLGFDSFYHRVGSLAEGGATIEDRIELSRATAGVGWRHPLVGGGLGAHAFVFPAYDTTGRVAIAEQADNDYAQLFEETGLVGVLLVLGGVGVVLGAIWRVLKTRHGAIRYAAVGVLYGLVAIALQSVTDFGQRLPGVFCVTAALGGVAVGLASKRGPLPVEDHGARRRVGVVVVGLLAACVWGAGLVGGVRDYLAENWWALAYDADRVIQRDGERVDPQRYVDLLAAAEQATRVQPAAVDYAYWLNAHRWGALVFASEGASPVATVAGREAAEKIVDELAAARRLCPTYGPAHTLEGQLRLVLGDAAGSRLVRQGAELAPNNPVACYAAAVDLLQEERSAANQQEAFDLLRRAVALDDSFYSDAAVVAVDAAGAVPFAIELADGQPSRLKTLADHLAGSADWETSAAEVLELAREAQERRVAAGEASSSEVANLARRMAAAGRLEEAVTLYREALAKRFDRMDWRLALVDALEGLGRIEEAHREARIATRLKPGSAAAKMKLESLTLRLPIEAGPDLRIDDADDTPTP